METTPFDILMQRLLVARVTALEHSLMIHNSEAWQDYIKVAAPMVQGVFDQFETEMLHNQHSLDAIPGYHEFRKAARKMYRLFPVSADDPFGDQLS